MSRARGTSKETAKLLEEARAAGAFVVQAKSCHWKVYVGSRLVTTISHTSSSDRGLRNARADLRRAGLEVSR